MAKTLQLKVNFQEIFYFLSAALVIMAVLEIIWPNIILAYFNGNYLFLLWLIVGLVSLTKK